MTSKIAPVILGVLVLGGVALFPIVASRYATAADDMQVIKGQIASIEPDASGQPGWIQSGIWLVRMSPSAQDGQNASLIARFQMVKPDGTAMHVHKIYSFKSSEMTQEGNSTVVLKGTATVTMKDGPVADVPLTVKVFGNSVIGFWIGPDKVDNHFGSGPVYGIVSDTSQTVMKDMHDMMEQGPSVNGTDQSNVLKMKADEIDEVYRWTTDAGVNPTITLVANKDNMIQIDNPTDEKHELVIESNGTEVASSGDIDPEDSGELTFKPMAAGTLEYHCEYHPDTMKGTIQVTGQ